MDFSALAQAGKKAEKLNEKIQDRFLEAYSQALETVAELNQLSAEDPFAALPLPRLRQAADGLVQALSLKPSIPQPYAVLSYLFFLMHNLELAVKYLKKAEEFAPPDTPKLLEMRLLYLSYIETVEDMAQRIESGELKDDPDRPAPIRPLKTLQFDSSDDFDLLDLDGI